MARHNIEKWSLPYALLKEYVKVGFSLFYRRLVVRGKHNIPKNKPVIFAPNHQNALMDALAVLTANKGQPVFLARSDIFSNRIVTAILTFLKIMPVYRIRDGYGNLQLNDQIIKKSVDVLAKAHPFVILPEGNHAGYRRLRPLKKGICRIAFQAEKETGFQLGIQIVPVGIDYSNYFKQHQTLFVNYGKPIDIEEYIPVYQDNPQKGNNELRDRIYADLTKYMVHISSRENYETINELRRFYKYRMKELLGLSDCHQPNKFLCDKALIAVLEKEEMDHPEKMKKLHKQVHTYKRSLKLLKLRNWVLNRPHYSLLSLIGQSLILVVGAPVFVFGFLNNMFPYFIPVLYGRSIHDPQFISSFKFVIGLVIFPIFYFSQTLAISFFTDGLWYPLIYLFSLLPAGLFALKYNGMMKKFIAKWRYNHMRRKKNSILIKSLELRNNIFSELDDIMEKRRNLMVKAYQEALKNI